MTTLHAIGNWIFYFFGFKGSGPYYGAWSGALSDVGEVTIFGAVIVALRHLNCHVTGCKGIRTHPVPGTPYRACRRHHPTVPTDGDITAEHIARQYALADPPAKKATPVKKAPAKKAAKPKS